MNIERIGKNISVARKKKDITQEELADRIGVSVQAVSKWENGHNLPDISNLIKISELTDTPLRALFDETDSQRGQLFHVREKYFQEEKMFTRMRAFAAAEGLNETYRALNFMRNCHSGQCRNKGKYSSNASPYIIHPLLMACQAHAYGIKEDSVLCAILLHDVAEDTGVTIDEFPFSDEVKELVGVLTFSFCDNMEKTQAKKEYFKRISENPKACLIKLLDRCDNISTMAASFEKERLKRYITETEEYVLPLAKKLKDESPQYSEIAFLIKYHIISVIETIKNLIL